MKKIVLKSFLAAIVIVISCKNSQEKNPIQSEEFQEIFSLEQLTDSLIKMQNERYDFQYFDIKTNEDALYFFEQNGIQEPENYIITQLMATNITADEHHPLIDYRPRRGKKFQINKIKVLNHKWVICDFSDGLDWGHLLVRFDLNDDKTLSFRTLDQILYVSEQKP